MGRALSRYRQVRVTITEEAGGRLTVRAMVKPVNDSWTMRHTVWSHSWRTDATTRHWTDLVGEALHAMARETLPTDE